jgi:P-type Cu+ transporter
LEKDPVCGMNVKTDEAGGRTTYQGKSFFFCSVSCKERFDRNPQTFAVKKMLDQETVGQADKS